MASRGSGRRGRPWGSSRPPPDFNQQAFVEVMSAAFTAISQTIAASSKGGPSDL